MLSAFQRFMTFMSLSRRRMSVAVSSKWRYAALFLLVAPLPGCFIANLSDLESYVDEVLMRPGGGIPPIPEFKRSPPYIYAAKAQNLRDPFSLFYEKKADELQQQHQLPEAWRWEISERNREELEAFELDSLRMVGTLERSVDERWGVIIDPDSVVHRVTLNNYIGKNLGKIINITESRVELRELVQDGQGRWEQRDAALSLVDEG